MAFLQSELPPSTAPVQARRTASARPITVVPRQGGSARFLRRAGVALSAAALLAIPGYLAGSATESLAIGILAADFLFLMAVAGWSAVVGGPRR